MLKYIRTMDYTAIFAQMDTVGACLEQRDRLANQGEFAEIKQQLKAADKETKKTLGLRLNQIRQVLYQACDQRILEIQSLSERDNFIQFDPWFYADSYQVRPGALHPLSQILEEIVGIFGRMGFDVFSGSQVETQWHNFTSVNTPDYHPARDMQDTFFLKQTDDKGEHYVMRTQVTANAVKYAQTHKPPFQVIFPGLVFRNENIDATHDINFTQFDMWLINQKTSLSQLVTLIERFFSEFYGYADLKVRLRPSYFPFVQPGFEGDIQCPFCHGEGCRVCKQTGWIEVFGAGPVHTSVIRNMGLDPAKWQGLAFGFGVDRLAQLKLKISGVSQFYNGNLDFLRGIA